jgi:hypothetical protein
MASRILSSHCGDNGIALRGSKRVGLKAILVHNAVLFLVDPGVSIKTGPQFVSFV